MTQNEEEKKIVEAFRGAFPFAYGFHYPSGTFVVRVPDHFPEDIRDEFTVCVVRDDGSEGDIVWTDFTHITCLGPLNGSELKKRLDEFKPEKEGEGR